MQPVVELREAGHRRGVRPPLQQARGLLAASRLEHVGAEEAIVGGGGEAQGEPICGFVGRLVFFAFIWVLL